MESEQTNSWVRPCPSPWVVPFTCPVLIRDPFKERGEKYLTFPTKALNNEKRNDGTGPYVDVP